MRQGCVFNRVTIVMMVLVTTTLFSVVKAPQSGASEKQLTPKMSLLLMSSKGQDKNIEIRSEKTYDYDCEIPRWGEAQCGGNYTVSNGKYVKIAMSSSGGKKVHWKLRNSGNGDELGSVDLEAGDRKHIWTNTTGHTVHVKFYADAEGLVKTRVTGQFVFGNY